MFTVQNKTTTTQKKKFGVCNHNDGEQNSDFFFSNQKTRVRFFFWNTRFFFKKVKKKKNVFKKPLFYLLTFTTFKSLVHCFGMFFLVESAEKKTFFTVVKILFFHTIRFSKRFLLENRSFMCQKKTQKIFRSKEMQSSIL